MQKLYLLDAYALIYRAYYAFIKNPRINSKGENTSAIFGFVNTLEEVIAKGQPTHIGVAFDPHGPTFRHEAYPLYKAQREETPEAIRFAVPIIKDILRAYRIPVLEVQGYEADDVIGTLAHQADEKGIETYMMTPDKDYGQLVTDRVKMYRPPVGRNNEAEILGVEEVKRKWGLSSPLQVIDMLGLMGDAVDNIPGCPGVGEKTAQKLIEEFGSIENLLASTDRLKGALKEKVEKAKEKIAFGFSKCDILKISDNEITFMTGEEDLDKGIHMIIDEFKIPLVFATFGPDGSKAYCGGTEVYVEGFLNPNTIETTGSGDTFCASALLHVLKYGIDGLKDADKQKELLTFANAAASLVTTKKGALCVMPTVDQVEAYIKESGR